MNDARLYGSSDTPLSLATTPEIHQGTAPLPEWAPDEVSQLMGDGLFDFTTYEIALGDSGYMNIFTDVPTHATFVIEVVLG